MKISKQAKRDAKTLFRACLENGVLSDDRVRQAVGKVVEAKPRGYVAILQHFHRLVKLDIDRRTAQVESSVELSADLQASVKANLETKYGAAMVLKFSVNPELIGGLRIQVGSEVYDGSIQGRLTQLKNNASL